MFQIDITGLFKKGLNSVMFILQIYLSILLLTTNFGYKIVQDDFLNIKGFDLILKVFLCWLFFHIFISGLLDFLLKKIAHIESENSTLSDEKIDKIDKTLSKYLKVVMMRTDVFITAFSSWIPVFYKYSIPFCVISFQIALIEQKWWIWLIFFSSFLFSYLLYRAIFILLKLKQKNELNRDFREIPQ